MNSSLLLGCSFTDPTWQQVTPWSVEYSKTYKSYIVAKAGMGIKGLCTEGMYFLKQLPDVKKVIIILPTLWRIDLEMDEEADLCNSMVDLLESTNGDWYVKIPAHRKWITSGGLHYDKNSEQAKIFDFLYKHQGFLVLLKEHFRSLQSLQDYCKIKNIRLYISAIADPLSQLSGLDYISKQVNELLISVDYNTWIRFDGKFIDEFLGHKDHPNTKEHALLAQHIIKQTEEINYGN